MINYNATARNSFNLLELAVDPTTVWYGRVFFSSIAITELKQFFASLLLLLAKDCHPTIRWAFHPVATILQDGLPALLQPSYKMCFPPCCNPATRCAFRPAVTQLQDGLSTCCNPTVRLAFHRLQDGLSTLLQSGYKMGFRPAATQPLDGLSTLLQPS
jgi:hypothetical protein